MPKKINHRYRSRLDIMADVIKITITGAKKTQIMFKANLSYKLLQIYMRTLLDEGLISQSDGKYVATDRGKEFLETYQKLVYPVIGKEATGKPTLSSEFLETYRKLIKTSAVT
jgi:predicted transcriptional regulator